MAFIPKTWVDDQIVYAEDMNRIEQGIAETDALLREKANPNLLDNWYFADPINQRGQTLYSSAAKVQYTIDRWLSRSWYVETEVMDGYIQLTETTGTQGTTIYFEQITEQTFIGKKTLSIMLNDGTLYWLSGSSDIVIDFVVDGKSFQFCWLNSGHKVRLLGDAGATIAIKAVKLEYGMCQTLAHQDENGNWVLNDPPPNKQQELAKCQRYFTRIRIPQNAYIPATMFLAEPTVANFRIELPTIMRTAPSCTFSGQGRFVTTNGNVIVPNSIYVKEDGSTERAVAVCVSFDALSPVCNGWFDGGSGMYIDATSDL